MRGRLRLWLILSALTLAHASASALAQNGYSFIDAERSATRYALAPARPQAACADLSAVSTGSSTIVAAEAIAGTDGVPEHCRISGLIAPQIRFEIDRTFDEADKIGALLRRPDVARDIKDD